MNLKVSESGERTVTLLIPTDGFYAPVHRAWPRRVWPEAQKSGAQLEPSKHREFAAAHSHDDEITSVGITLEGALSEENANRWLGPLLASKGQDILRTKGILNIAKDNRRFVFQAVHMLLDGGPDRPWQSNEKRQTEIVFIGRNLDRDELPAGLKGCLV